MSDRDKTQRPSYLHEDAHEHRRLADPYDGIGKRTLAEGTVNPALPVWESGLVQRRAAEQDAPRANARANVEQSASDAGSPLPAELRERFESSLDADLSSVRVHTGGASATAAEAVGAKAYTAGQDIHFAAGAYDPASTAGRQLIAHEVAHTVQQSGATGATAQYKLDVSSPQDGAEQEADRAAEAMVAGKRAAVSKGSKASVQLKEAEAVPRGPSERERKKFGKEFEQGWNEVREDTADPQKGDPFGGAGTDGDTLGGKRLGQAGYGAELLMASSRSAQAHGGEWGLIAAPVAPDSSTLDASIGDQSQAYFKLTQADWYGGDPSWVERRKAYSRDWCADNMATLERHQFEQWRLCAAYNDWVPLANASHVAMAELVETANLMGYDTSKDKDSARFIEGLEASLDMANQLVDAKVLGKNNDQSWSSRTGHSDAVSQAQPMLEGTEATPEIKGLQDAYKALQLAHYGIYQGLLEDRKAILAGDRAKVGGAIAEINGTIAFWTGLAGFVESSWKPASSAADGSYARALDQKFDGSKRYGYREASKAGDAALALERGSRDYHEIRSDKLQQHQQNFEDYYDTWGPGGKDDVEKGKQYEPPSDGMHLAGKHLRNKPRPIHVDGTEPEPAPAPSGEAAGFPSLSLSSIVGGALNLYYGEKLDVLKGRLATLDERLEKLGLAQGMVKARERLEAFKTAAKQLEDRRTDLEQYRLKKRQQEMVRMGGELDAYAREHRKDLKSQGKGHLAAADGQEIYTTMMAALAKVEQYRSISGMALATFPYDDFVRTITGLQQERDGQKRPEESASRDREKAYKLPPPLRPMSQTEIEIYQQIAGTYLAVLRMNEHWRIRLGGVESRLAALMKKLEGFGPNADTVGQRF